MRSILAVFWVVALVGCAQPPPRASHGVEGILQESTKLDEELVPHYPTWQEVAQTDTGPQAVSVQTALEGGTALLGGATLHKVQRRVAGRVFEMDVVAFNSRQYVLKVLDQPQDWSGGGKISESLRAAQAVAGVNGGFFTPDFKPMGLMVANGRRTGAWQSNKLLTGAVVVEQGRPRLLWNAEAHKHLQAEHFLQAGPRLVDASMAVTGLERRKQTRRTFIATDGGQRWVLGLAHGVSLGELAEALAAGELLPGFRLERALNLDGGRSSALYYRTSDGREHSDPGWSTVRNYLGIVPR